MSDTPVENIPPEKPAAKSPATPPNAPPQNEIRSGPLFHLKQLGDAVVNRVPQKTPEGPPKERRDFFGEAMREMLMPFTGIIERKINPIIEAMERLPDDIQHAADSNFGLLDQMHANTPRLPAAPRRKIPERYMRPPGAMTPVTDGGYESVCSRCAECVEVCPADAIQLDPAGLIAEGFPYIVADDQPCVVCAELACMKSCPTGALRLVDRLDINMGTAAVDHSICLRNHGEGCTLCIDICPIDGKAEGTLSALFISPDSGKIRVRKDICIGCGMCEHRCPTEPRAITIRPYEPPIDPIIA